ASNGGWLDCFKKRHGIQQMTVSGECGDVSEATVTGWHDRVKSLIAGYSPEDI
uniref:HTH CENPB-type domain-containing protein n=1 Tax=Amphimedon queenslandica TaxID=400682 RepID=A0A1X7U324_AMPQE